MSEFLAPLWSLWEGDRRRSIKILCGVAVSYYVTDSLVRKVVNIIQKRQTTKKRLAKQKEVKETKAKLEAYLKGLNISTSTVERIVNLSFTDLQAELQSGKLKASDVLHAYQIKALEVDKKFGCVTEVVSEAEAIASALDSNTGKKGPLFGIPISVKETYNMKGYPCTGGMMYYLDMPVNQDCPMVEVMRKQGAIPFVRTNVPQSLMTFECANPLYGTTTNPHDPTRIPGGSSGGEASLLAGGGSILGLGGDIGGSLRIPAHMSGCCSIKPTLNRLSRKGQLPFNKGETLVQAQVGPMANEVDALVTSMRCLLVQEMFNLDPTVPPIPFRDEMFKEKRKLTIGFYIDDGHLTPAPTCQRAVLEVKAILEAQGHTVVPFRPVDVLRMAKLFCRSIFADAGQSYLNVLEKDTAEPGIAQITAAMKLPRWCRSFLAYVIRLITKNEFSKVVINAGSGVRNITEYWDLALEMEDYKADFLQKWRDNNLDAVICPGFAFPAVPLNRVLDVIGGATYTNLYNVLDYPAGMLHVTKVTQSDLDNFQNYRPRSWMEQFIKKYSEGSKGLPVGVQFIGLPYEEEQVLRLMKDVETSLNKGR